MEHPPSPRGRSSTVLMFTGFATVSQPPCSSHGVFGNWESNPSYSPQASFPLQPKCCGHSQAELWGGDPGVQSQPRAGLPHHVILVAFWDVYCPTQRSRQIKFRLQADLAGTWHPTLGWLHPTWWDSWESATPTSWAVAAQGTGELATFFTFIGIIIKKPGFCFCLLIC